MSSFLSRFLALETLCVTLVSSAGCRNGAPERSDHPRLESNVAMKDVAFHSAALGRDMRYRVFVPASIKPGRRLSVVYLLHGGGAGFRQWSDDSNVARFVGEDLILIMPQGDYSYYVNAAEDRGHYEDYIVQDLVAHAEAEFPIAKDRAHRAIVGVSMGGFGAINIALRHPDLFAFAGALSPAIDVARRKFSMRRVGQSRALLSIFGPWGSDARRRNDPFVAAQSAAPNQVPYLYLSCGEREGLLPPNREFASVLARKHVAYEFHVVTGDHNWTNWNQQLPGLFASLRRHVRADD